MPPSSHPPKLLDQVRATLRRKHYSYRTETTYVGWIKRFIQFHGFCCTRMGGYNKRLLLLQIGVDHAVHSVRE